MLLSAAEKRRILRVHMRKGLLKERGFRYADFGDASLVKRVIHEEQPNPKLRRAISERLKVSHRKLWPT